MARVAKDPILAPQTTTPAAPAPAQQTTIPGPATQAATQHLFGGSAKDTVSAPATTTPAAAAPVTPAAAAPVTPAATPQQVTVPAQTAPAVQEPVVLAAMPNVDPNAVVNQLKGNIPDVAQTLADQRALLSQWQGNAIQQSNNKIDYSVNQGVTELERAWEDAQPQFKEQQESITRDEMQSRDNAALYAEARGDKGGIGQEQYSSIMNTAAQNRLAVQQAQTKLSTDTQRQIADLRAQGEFDKADALLEISQQYLSQLMSLEQWAFDAGMSVAQFNANLDQWLADYQMAMAQYQTDVDMWNAEFNYTKEQDKIANDQWQQSFDQGVTEWQTALENERNAYAAELLLNSGNGDLTEEQLKAIGFSPEQAAAYVKDVNTDKQASAGFATPAVKDMNADQIYRFLYDAGYTDSSDSKEMITDLQSYGVDGDLARNYVDVYKGSKYGALRTERDLQNALLAEATIPENIRNTFHADWASTGGYVTSPGIWDAMVTEYGEDAIRGLGLRPFEDIKPSEAAKRKYEYYQSKLETGYRSPAQDLQDVISDIGTLKGKAGFTETDILWLLCQLGLN